MKPSICRMVVYKNAAEEHNGTHEHPAVVNRVWSPNEATDTQPVCVNLTVFPDCAPPRSRTSIYFYPSRQAAEAYIRGQQERGNPNAIGVCFPPDRV